MRILISFELHVQTLDLAPDWLPGILPDWLPLIVLHMCALSLYLCVCVWAGICVGNVLPAQQALRYWQYATAIILANILFACQITLPV